MLRCLLKKSGRVLFGEGLWVKKVKRLENEAELYGRKLRAMVALEYMYVRINPSNRGVDQLETVSWQFGDGAYKNIQACQLNIRKE